MHSQIKHHLIQTEKNYSESARYAAGHHIGVGNNSKMRKFRNVCIEWIGTCILVQIAVTFGLIWFFNNMVTITTGSARNVNRCTKHIDETIGNLNPPISPYLSASGGGQTILRKLSSDYNIPNIIESQQQIQEPTQQDDLLMSNQLDPNTGIFDKWRLYKTHPFVSVATNLSLLNEERNVCLAAQTSLDRLYSLTETLEQWSGPVSIALFTPDIEYHVANIYIEYLKKCFPAVRNQVSFHYTYPVAHPIRNETPEKMKTMFPSDLMETIVLESSEGCEMTPKQFADKLLKHTTNEKAYSSWRTSLEHPQNLLRNTAKSGCQTKYIMLPDIDMIPNKNLDLKLEKFLNGSQPPHCKAVSKTKKKPRKSDKCAFVVPVYEISRDVEQLPKDKSELLGLVRNKLSRPFHSALFSINQKASRLKQWESIHPNSNQTENELDNTHPSDEVNVAYKVDKYQFKYEPLYVARSDTPIFDERFIGFGMTRNTQVYEMYVANYSFYLLDNAFSSHWGFQTLKDRPEWRAKQQTMNNHRFDDFAKEISARYGRDPYDMLTKLKTLNYKNIKVAYGKADSLLDKENISS